MSVWIAPGFVMKYGLISPRTVEPGQKERVWLMVAEYDLSRQVLFSDLSAEATSGVIHGAGRNPFPLSRGVAAKRFGRYKAAPSSNPVDVGGMLFCW